MTKYIWYKCKMAGPFVNLPLKTEDRLIEMFMSLVDHGTMACLQSVPPLNQDMEQSPDIVHIVCEKKDMPDGTPIDVSTWPQ